MKVLKKHLEDLKKIYKSNFGQNILFIIFSCLFVLSFNYYNNIQEKQTITNLILFALTYYLFKTNQNIPFKEKKIPIFFGIILSFILVIGNIVYKYNNIDILFSNKKTILLVIIEFIGFFKVIGELTYILFKKFNNIDAKNNKLWKFYNYKYFPLFLWAFIFILWLPAFLAYYPGILSYDSVTQTTMIFNKAYTQFHPPLHTFIWSFCLTFGQKIGIEPLIIYCLIQMVLLSFALTKLIKYLIKKKVNNWLILISILFIINPVIAIFSLTMTKDVYFAIFFILALLELFKLIENPKIYLKKKINWVKYTIFTLLATLFRNNVIYVYILLLPFMYFYFKTDKIKIICLALIPILINIFIGNCIYPTLGIIKDNSQEKLSVPMQQLIYSAQKNPNLLSDYEISELQKYFNYFQALELYNPRFADPVKNQFNSTYYTNNSKDFYILWLRLLAKFPKDYISAFLSLNIDYWYPDANTLDNYSERQYIETSIVNMDYYKVSRSSKMPKLLTILENFASYKFFENKPIVSTIFSISTPFWLLLFTFFVLLYRKHYKQILMILPLLFLWLTYMAGPVSNFRYIFPLFVLYPLLISLIFNSSKLLKKED